ncbi:MULTISPECIES: branched-chain amino acid aminotransferase [Aerococcus]|jgi:branched-chain amino acid aminotransferase|uniref:Branched-chain-amino-acid aminotransferase n=1 Tax=Aerococcus agrisoli TaxID=2487350 RepID=A0A3N4G0C6_9LACT|nr:MULTISPECIES: branched-chain amino acid aminotransferase [Aerococcus]OYQ66541.1 branched chain amino acid aminotransferase [Aerococcus sp. 1KP-2016]OYW70507.1 MAG: branched chain amino acid aminotransferase [Aerococcus viridans]RPA56403.1 branched-chain amino acid aminotransferase [Aerococcus agrisoli]
MAVDINWEELGFSYMNLPYRWRAYWKDGEWYKEGLETENTIQIAEGAPILHYGQGAFEGLKAYRAKDGTIQIFRPDQNAKRLIASAERLLMPEIPVDDFIHAVKEVVKANADYVPPYGTGATLYLRPTLIGVGDNIGVHAASEYIFTIFAMPVGPYFKGGMAPTAFTTSKYDRAAPQGTGAAKVGGNYAGSLKPGEEAKEAGYSDVVYLDPATHTKIEEVGAANFFGIEKETNKFVTPKSPSILPSITKYSLLWLAEHRLGLEVEEGDVYIDDLDRFSEAGACGTAAVISPVGSITHNGNKHVFYSETEVGPVTKRLYDELVGIQYGDVEAPEGWIVKLED